MTVRTRQEATWGRGKTAGASAGLTGSCAPPLARSKGTSSPPGSPGYNLTVEAIVQEVARASALRHQADDMRQRWIEIEKIYHGKETLS